MVSGFNPIFLGQRFRWWIGKPCQPQVILDLRDLPRFEAEGQSEAVNAFKRRPANVGNEAYDDCPENLKGRYKVYVIYNPYRIAWDWYIYLRIDRKISYSCR